MTLNRMVTFSNLCLVILLCGLILIFAPYLLKLNCQYHQEYYSIQGSVIATNHLIFGNISLGIGYLLEIVASIKSLGALRGNKSKFILILGLLLPNLLQFNHNSADISLYNCCAFAKQLFICGALFTSISFDSCTISSKMAYLCGILSGVAYVSVCAWKGYIFPSSFVSNLQLSLFVIFAFVMTILSWWQLKNTFAVNDYPVGMTQKHCCISTLCILLYSITHGFVYYCYGCCELGNFSKNELGCHIWIDIVATIITFTTPTFLERSDKQHFEAQIEAKKRFVRYISHEIRTPLNTVLMGMHLLSDKFVDMKKSFSNINYDNNDKVSVELVNLQHSTDDAGVMIQDMSFSCKAAVDILNDLLLYDKIEEGPISLEQQYVHVCEFIEQAAKPFEIQAMQSRVTFEYKAFTEDIYDKIIFIDIFKFTQVFRNLISNALKFTPDGGRVDIVAYTIDKTAKEEYLRIEVKDNGCGISFENQQKLFKGSPIQFDAAKLQQGNGSGLGLWITKAIVDQHNYKVGVFSSGKYGEGSTFYVEMPIVTQLPHDQTLVLLTHSIPVTTTSTATRPMSSRRKKFSKALVVDDSKLNRKMLVKVISKYFDEIDEAADGVEAVELFQQSIANTSSISTYSMIFLDALMPRMDGMHACECIRSLGFQHNIVAVTGNVLPADTMAFKLSGANYVLRKPVDIDEVTRLISELPTITVDRKLPQREHERNSTMRNRFDKTNT